VVILIRPYGNNHYVCSFKKDGKLYIMDYGTPYKTVTGLHGPYNSLEEYKQFYEKNHPMKRRIEAILISLSGERYAWNRGITLTGSFNFTKAAEENDTENLLVIHDKALAARYIKNWEDYARIRRLNPNQK